ncbi:MAG: glycosyltransferase family 39 protein, partial [Candidatus Hadarchaeum sp.]
AKMTNRPERHILQHLLLVAVMLVAFALRMYRLGEQPLSWDEGWSVGLSSLPWSEINRITALDVHPPFYYWVFKLWLHLGRSELIMRFLSVIAGMLVIPLSYVIAKAWVRLVAGQSRECVGMFAAYITALSPFLIYYAQVVRMFSLCVALSLLATYALLKAVSTERFGFYALFVLSATLMLYTFYYTTFVLAAVFLYVVTIVRASRWRKLCASAIAVTVLYLPWLWYAVPPMLERIGNRTGMALSLADAFRYLSDGVFGLVFAYGSGWIAVYIVFALLALAFYLTKDKRQAARLLALPFVAILLTLIAVSLGARAHMFAARYLIAASPFLALGIAWALGVHWERAKWLGALGAAILALSMFPTINRYIYAKAYEVSAAFDPQADYRYLQGKTFPDDVVFFNVLSLAGLYERFRADGDPPWSYVLRWDPVIESLEPALASRVQPAASQHRRLWFVLYKGTVGANFALKEWLDLHLFPSFGQWREDTLYLQYLAPTAQTMQLEPGLTFDGRIRLEKALFTPETLADDRITVRLIWTAPEGIPRSYKVFVHLYTMDGRLVAQHDSIPANELRPTWSWKVGEYIVDNHGLWVPAETSGPLRLVVGLYDPESNTRLTLPGGADHAVISTLPVLPRALE